MSSNNNANQDTNPGNVVRINPADAPPSVSAEPRRPRSAESRRPRPSRSKDLATAAAPLAPPAQVASPAPVATPAPLVEPGSIPAGALPYGLAFYSANVQHALCEAFPEFIPVAGQPNEFQTWTATLSIPANRERLHQVLAPFARLPPTRPATPPPTARPVAPRPAPRPAPVEVPHRALPVQPLVANPPPEARALRGGTAPQVPTRPRQDAPPQPSMRPQASTRPLPRPPPPQTIETAYARVFQDIARLVDGLPDVTLVISISPGDQENGQEAVFHLGSGVAVADDQTGKTSVQALVDGQPITLSQVTFMREGVMATISDTADALQEMLQYGEEGAMDGEESYEDYEEGYEDEEGAYYDEDADYDEEAGG